MEISAIGWIILGITNIPVFFVLGWIWFRDWDDFCDAVRLWLTPDIISAFRGEFWDDWWAQMKLGYWILSCFVCMMAEVYLLQHWAG